MKKFIAVLVAFTPALVFAADADITDADSLVTKLVGIGNTLTQLLVAFAVIWIIYNVVRYIVMADSDARKPIGNAILWGIVGLFVILSIWGLVNILRGTFITNDSIDKTEIPQIPALSSVDETPVYK